MSELKPCPFCGSNDLIERDNMYQGSSVLSYWIVCRHCGSESKAANNLAAAHDAWNMRAESAELSHLREQVKVLRAALGKIADATTEGIDGDEWFNDIANIALEQTKPKGGE